MNFAPSFLVVAMLCCLGAASEPSRQFCSVPECVNSGNANLSSVVLCNQCMVKLLSHSEKALQFFKFQKKVINDDGQTLFTDLNTDVLYHIVEEMDLESTLNLLQVYPGSVLSRIASAAFRKNYKDHTIIIDARQESTELGTTDTVVTNGKIIRVAQFAISKSLLENLGGSIERLEINSYGSKFPTKFRIFSILSRFIYNYASESLKSLNLKWIDGDTFVHFNRTFGEVEELSLKTTVDEEIIKPGNAPLNELFPKLRRLEMECRVTMNYSWIFSEFPHLEHLSLDIGYNLVRNEEEIFEGLLSRNTQIRSIQTNSLSNYLYGFIQKYQLNIEHLNVTQFNVKGARFDHLKSLAVTYMDRDEILQLSVPEIESLDLHYNREIDVKWIPFLQRHGTVTRLTIRELMANGGDKVIQMISHIPNLVELSIEHTDKFLPVPTYAFISETINGIITISQKLEKFNFKTEPVLTEAELNNIQAKYGNEWELTVERSQSGDKDVIKFSFEKRI